MVTQSKPEQPQPLSDTRSSLTRKLHPQWFTAMSPKMASIVGCILDEQFTTPRLVKLVVTADNFVMGMVEGDCGYNEWVGTLADLRHNWSRLLKAADLTVDEFRTASNLFQLALRHPDSYYKG